MEAITSQLQAMMLSKPNKNTPRGKRQAGRRSYRRKRASKAKYNLVYYKNNKYAINRRNAVKRGNSKKRSLNRPPSKSGTSTGTRKLDCFFESARLLQCIMCSTCWNLQARAHVSDTIKL